MAQSKPVPRRINGERLAEIRIDQGLTIADLARMSGHHYQTIRRIEIEARNASAVATSRIARALRVPVTELRKPAGAPVRERKAA